VVDPDTGCDPTPLSMETFVALVVLQTSVEAWPVPTVFGDAEKETVGAGTVTVTVAVLVVVPPGPLAVSVYVVVDDGLTLVLPDVAWLPTPLSMEIDVAFDDVHVSVDDCPGLMVVGAAEKVAVGAAAPTVTVTCLVGGEALAVENALNVYVVVEVGLTLVEPLFGLLPTPLSMTTLVTDAPVVVQESVDGDPEGTVLGLAVKDVMQPLPMSKLLENVP
jgi:hypothetical protein